ncbi:MAG TPA: hypothetical protein VFC67_04210 [Prolixibacteraceae bacterium]|nr:hypothetical protein [Prolixibacteraceae bacterium]
MPTALGFEMDVNVIQIDRLRHHTCLRHWVLGWMFYGYHMKVPSARAIL